MSISEDLKGVVGAAITPITKSFDIDSGRLRAHCDTMMDQGCRMVSAFGTTGEGASFSVAQKLTALAEMKAAGLDMSRQIPGVITSALDDAARLVRGYADLGCRAALILPPFYYAYSAPGGLGDYFAAVIERAGSPDIDVMLYNFPAFSGLLFTPERVQEVRDQLGDRVVGIKDSTGDLEAGKRLIRAFPDVAIYTGDDRILSRMVHAGGAGMIGGLPNAFPADCTCLAHAAQDDPLQDIAAQRIAAVDAHGGLSVLKGLVAQLYNDPAFAPTMPPLRPAPDETIKALAADLFHSEEESA